MRQWKQLSVFVCLIFVFVFSNLSGAEKSVQGGITFLPDNKLLPVLLDDIKNAKSDISLAMYMFKTDDKRFNLSSYIQKALIEASERGVKVFIVLDSESRKKSIIEKFNSETGEEFIAAGITVVYDNPRKRMHSKAIVLDKTIAYIGSHNFTHSALKYNNEASVRIVSKEIATEIDDYIRNITK
jgi:phosphatidylserine/phosphatidylglycerophosphate/cardiolipin synthase-like enzyme